MGGRFFLWLCVAFVLGIVVSLVVANLGASEKKVDRPLERLHDTRDPAFARDLSLLLGPPIVDGNRVEALRQRRPRSSRRCSTAIRGARDDDHLRDLHLLVGRRSASEFAEALAERARAGVKVHVLLDWVGSAEDGRRRCSTR